MLGLPFSQNIIAQTLIAKETVLQPVDSSIKKEPFHSRLIGDTKKITDNPAYNFKNLFESDAS